MGRGVERSGGQACARGLRYMRRGGKGGES